MANKRIYLCLAHMSDAGLEQRIRGTGTFIHPRHTVY